MSNALHSLLGAYDEPETEDVTAAPTAKPPKGLCVTITDSHPTSTPCKTPGENVSVALDAPPTAVQQNSLAVWQVLSDPNTGYNYYWNTHTGAVSWELPREETNTTSANVPPKATVEGSSENSASSQQNVLQSDNRTNGEGNPSDPLELLEAYARDLSGTPTTNSHHKVPSPHTLSTPPASPTPPLSTLQCELSDHSPVTGQDAQRPQQPHAKRPRLETNTPPPDFPDSTIFHTKEIAELTERSFFPRYIISIIFSFIFCVSFS
ncbi:hypothetical protein Pelo_8007 [Pelomyxa schiedti]|nr:hypothetical protein Pelo_8007 [Pelomyxa schiedti]